MLIIKFIGNECWFQATNAYNSNFFGQSVGSGAINLLITQISLVDELVKSNKCQFSTLIGYQVGKKIDGNWYYSNNTYRNELYLYQTTQQRY
jgi:hypothetical protein